MSPKAGNDLYVRVPVTVVSQGGAMHEFEVDRVELNPPTKA
jgi:hypothetical protein